MTNRKVTAKEAANELDIDVNEVLEIIGKKSPLAHVDMAELRKEILRRSEAVKASTSTAIEVAPRAFEVSQTRASRRATKSDRAKSDRLNEVVTKYRAITRPFRPENIHEAGNRVWYTDPILGGEYKIYITNAEYLALDKDSAKDFPIISDLVKRQMRDNLGSMYCVYERCIDCNRTLPLSLDDKVYKLLDGDFYAPLTKKVPREKWIGFPREHRVCQLLMQKMVKFQIEHRDLDPDDPALRVKRTAAYKQFIFDILPEAQQKERGITSKAVRDRMIAIQEHLGVS